MFSLVLEIKASPIGIHERSDGDKDHTVKRLFGVITLLNLPMMKRERENERALKCLCLAKGYIHLLFYRRARWRERRGGEGEKNLTEKCV